MNKTINLSIAHKNDALPILRLFAEVYRGKYPNPLFSQFDLLEEIIESDSHYIFIAKSEDRLLACVHFQYDKKNLFAKAGSAIVVEDQRGKSLTENLLRFGIEFLSRHKEGLKLVYATTRTVHKAAQVLTEKMGFKKLGIFPNVHKTDEYETHTLVCYYLKDAFDHRYMDFKIHPKLKRTADIALNECGLALLEEARDWEEKIYQGELPELELINAAKFVSHQYQKEHSSESLDLAFFPFVTPNAMITSPDLAIQVFLNINSQDKHCVITGLKIDRSASVDDLLLKVCKILREEGVRYIEMISRAHRLNIIDKILRAKFIPSGYLPAFQLDSDKRYDYVIFSRSFEVLDFSETQLTGVSALFLSEYIKLWEELALQSKS